MKKYEQEIRELLEKIEDFVPDTTAAEREREGKKKAVGVMPPAPRPITPRRSFSLMRWLRSHNLSAGLAFLILGFGFVVAGLIIKQQAPGLLIVAQTLAVIGAVIYVLPVILRVFMGRDVNSDPKAWRGQSIEAEPIVNLGKLRQRFGKRGGNNRPNSWNDRNRTNRW